MCEHGWEGESCSVKECEGGCAVAKDSSVTDETSDAEMSVQLTCEGKCEDNCKRHLGPSGDADVVNSCKTSCLRKCIKKIEPLPAVSRIKIVKRIEGENISSQNPLVQQQDKLKKSESSLHTLQ